MFPPFLLIMWRTSLTTRLRLLVTTWVSMPTPPGPYPSKVASSYCSPSSCPVPRRMARSMFSLGMFSPLAARIAVRKRGLELGSPPPMRAAMEISRMILVKARPRFASVAAFLCLIVAHFECPDMTHPLLFRVPRRGRSHRWIDFSPQNGFGERRPLSGRILRRPSGYRTSNLPMYCRQDKRHHCGHLRVTPNPCGTPAVYHT